MSEALFLQGGEIAAEEGPLVAGDVWIEDGVSESGRTGIIGS